MEGKKSPVGYSSSNFASDLFGSKDSSVPKPSGLFDTIFAIPSSKALGRGGPMRSETTEQKEGKLTGKPGRDSDTSEIGKIHVPLNEDGTLPYGEKRPPCHYSSSIYYGGQDVFSNPTNNQTSSSSSPVYSTLRNKEGEDDSGSASRGNWWQGSLYY